MAQEPLKILVSGIGVAGASLALMLARHPGFKVKPNITVVERSSSPRTTGQAIDIRGPGVDVIRYIGLEPAIKARHTSETGMAFLNSRGDIVAQFDATGDAKNQSVTSEYEILRGDLTGLLVDGILEAKEKGANVNIVYGEYIKSLEDLEDGVNVKFTHGKLADQTFDAVIAADGSSSRTRAMIFGEADRKEFVRPSGMYIGFFTIPRIASDDGLYRWCTLPKGMSMHLRPHGNGKTMGCYFAVCFPTPAPNAELDSVIEEGVAASKAWLRRRFQDAGWQSDRFLAGLDAADDFYMTHWCQVITPQWVKGRCVTVGDAAMATMGIGTSLAMTGAWMIAGELSKITSSKDVAAALRSYESLFRPYVSEVTKPPPGAFQMANPQSAWGVWIFQTIVWLVALTRIHQIAMRFFGGSKDWSPPDYGWNEAEAPEAKKTV